MQTNITDFSGSQFSSEKLMDITKFILVENKEPNEDIINIIPQPSLDYLPDLEHFVLTNDPLIHILQKINYKDLFTLKCVCTFYNKSQKVNNAIHNFENNNILTHTRTELPKTISLFDRFFSSIDFHYNQNIANYYIRRSRIGFTRWRQ